MFLRKYKVFRKTSKRRKPSFCCWACHAA